MIVKLNDTRYNNAGNGDCVVLQFSLPRLTASKWVLIFLYCCRILIGLRGTFKPLADVAFLEIMKWNVSASSSKLFLHAKPRQSRL